MELLKQRNSKFSIKTHVALPTHTTQEEKVLGYKAMYKILSLNGVAYPLLS